MLIKNGSPRSAHGRHLLRRGYRATRQSGTVAEGEVGAWAPCRLLMPALRAGGFPVWKEMKMRMLGMRVRLVQPQLRCCPVRTRTAALPSPLEPRLTWRQEVFSGRWRHLGSSHSPQAGSMLSAPTPPSPLRPECGGRHVSYFKRDPCWNGARRGNKLRGRDSFPGRCLLRKGFRPDPALTCPSTCEGPTEIKAA